MNSKSILMNFVDEEDLLYGIDTLQHFRIPIREVYAPHVIRGIEAKLQIDRIRLGNTFVKYGCFGGITVTTLAYCLWSKGSLSILNSRLILELLFNLFIIAITFFFANRLFPNRSPKVIVLKQNDRRYLIVVDADHITPNEEIINLFKYSEAFEISPAIKNMIIA